MIHPQTDLRFVSEAVGHGLVANAFIPRGTVVWVRDDFDLLFSQEEIERLPPSYRAITERYAPTVPQPLSPFFPEQGMAELEVMRSS